MNLKDSLFVTGYNWGTTGSGDGDWTPYLRFAGARFYDDLAVFKSGRGMVPMHSSLVANGASISPPSLERPLAATGRNVDAAYEILSGQGFKVMVCPQGAFANQDLPDGASFRKHPPIDKDDDPLDPDSYLPYALLYQQIVLRWGPDKNEALERVYEGSNDFFSTDPGTGRNTVWAFQAGNELNFRWHGGRILTAEQTGAMWAMCYKLAREASPNARLVAPSFLSATADLIREFLEGFIAGCGQLGIEPGWDWHPSFHRYHRVGNQGQLQVDGDTGASPESVDAYALYRGIVEVCDEYGTLRPMLTETGWNDDPSAEGKLQRAPLQDGYSLSESRALLEFRNLLIAKAAGIHTVCTYHIADDYEGSWGNGMGWHNGARMDHPDFLGEARWSPKPSVRLLEQLMAEMGDQIVYEESFNAIDGSFSVATNKGVIEWTDSGLNPKPKFTRVGSVTPPPVEPIDPPPPPIDPPVEPWPTPFMVKLAENEQGTFWFQPNES